MCAKSVKGFIYLEHTAATTVIYKLHKVVFLIFCFNNSVGNLKKVKSLHFDGEAYPIINPIINFGFKSYRN